VDVEAGVDQPQRVSLIHLRPGINARAMSCAP
jgi:hypothetical protein